MARQPGGLSEAIRKALAVNGVEAGGKEIKAYLMREYPDLSDKINGSSFGSGLSNEKKKMREGNDDRAVERLLTNAVPTTPKAGAAHPTATNGSAPDLGDFIRGFGFVKEAVGVLGKEGVKKLLDAL